MIRTMTMVNEAQIPVNLKFIKSGKTHTIRLMSNSSIKYTFSDKDAELLYGDKTLPLDAVNLKIVHNRSYRAGERWFAIGSDKTVCLNIAESFGERFNAVADESLDHKEEPEVSFSNISEIPCNISDIICACRDQVFGYAVELGFPVKRAYELATEYGHHVINADMVLHYNDKRHAFNWLMDKLDKPEKCVTIKDSAVSMSKLRKNTEVLIGRGRRFSNRWG